MNRTNDADYDIFEVRDPLGELDLDHFLDGTVIDAEEE